MPIYEYQCPECERVDEAWHSMNDTPVMVCVDCNVTMKRIISSTNGWVPGSSTPCKG